MKDNTTIGVIEIRKARNGWVVSAIEAHYHHGDNFNPRGWGTYLVQSNSPKDIAAVIAKVFEDFPVSEEMPVPPARKLP